MKLGSPEAMRVEASQHDWEYERRSAEAEQLEIEREEREEEDRLLAMGEARKEYDAATPAERKQVLHQEDEDECPHDEHDHCICLECGADITDDLVGAAEFARDCREDR